MSEAYVEFPKGASHQYRRTILHVVAGALSARPWGMVDDAHKITEVLDADILPGMIRVRIRLREYRGAKRENDIREAIVSGLQEELRVPEQNLLVSFGEAGN
jgi:hypothetical protein